MTTRNARPKRTLSPTNASNAVLPDRLVEQLLAASPAATDAAALGTQSRARQALMRRIATDASGATRTVRAVDRAWQRCARGVERMVVDEAGPMHTWLLRLAPGASLLAHSHDHGDEESFVLSGSCVLNGESLSVGDYHHAREGSQHDSLVSETGCVLWLRLPAAQARAMMPVAVR